jgi:hypothetical protein
MQVTDPIKKNLKQFQKAYLHDYGIELTDKQAYEALFNFVKFFETLEKIDNNLKIQEMVQNFDLTKIKQDDNIEMDTAIKQNSTELSTS